MNNLVSFINPQNLVNYKSQLKDFDSQPSFKFDYVCMMMIMIMYEK